MSEARSIAVSFTISMTEALAGIRTAQANLFEAGTHALALDQDRIVGIVSAQTQTLIDLERYVANTIAHLRELQADAAATTGKEQHG